MDHITQFTLVRPVLQPLVIGALFLIARLIWTLLRSAIPDLQSVVASLAEDPSVSSVSSVSKLLKLNLMVLGYASRSIRIAEGCPMTSNQLKGNR